ncbi:MAG TPA: acetyl-CoA carboxylase biotin carboxyl carrier protein [Pricia antarctica]|uniref:Biotin carboxyl carrier protein of acetyl-CoA carboxylase n=1 Tax=Pricia antarctica TaxID=641691 RepID=A0A831QTC6_9FLAO|nr:acetyl-CoA carboxylase biotin carboxyl carrier protein [Pricia antarctica]
MDIKEIQSLIKFVAKSGAREVKLETDEIKITIKTGAAETEHETTYIQQIPMGQPQMTQAAPPQMQTGDGAASDSAKAGDNDDNSKYITIKSPIIGTFYRKPSPDKDSFVEVGTNIKKGDVLCVIEAMKLFNDIESEVSGKIVKILVEDSSPVEFDQPLFLVDPS